MLTLLMDVAMSLHPVVGALAFLRPTKHPIWRYLFHPKSHTTGHLFLEDGDRVWLRL
jgi:hypothetical protein